MPIAGNSASLVEIAGENLTAVTAVCAVRRNRSAGNSAGKAATSAGCSCLFRGRINGR